MPDAVWAVDRYPPDLSRANETHPVLTPSMHFSTRHQRFACVRLLGSHLTESRPAFSSTLTTIALYDSSLRWFEACSCKPTSRGRPLISRAAWLLWRCLNHSSSFAPSWRTLVQMPAPLRPGTQMPCSLATDLGRKDRTKTVPPIPHRLMAHIDPAFVKQILNIAEREWKPNIQHHRKTDNLGRGFEIAERVAGHVGDITKLRPSAQAQVPLTLPYRVLRYALAQGARPHRLSSRWQRTLLRSLPLALRQGRPQRPGRNRDCCAGDRRGHGACA